MKLSITEIVLFIALLVSVNANIRVNRANNTPISETLISLHEYIRKLEVRGEKTVVLFSSGPLLNKDGEALEFVDKTVIDEIDRVLKENNYTFIAINSPCLADAPNCLEEFTRLATGVSSLEPEAVIYKGINSGVNADIFNREMKSEQIPIYTFGSEILIDYKVYTGPNNVQLGVNAYEGIKDKIKKDQTAIFIDTQPLIERDPKDNGFPRINAVRSLMVEKGVKQITLFTRWSKTQSYDELVNLFQKNKNIDYIFTPSGEIAEAAAIAVDGAGIASRVKIISLDFTHNVAVQIKKGLIYGAISQGLKKQGNYIANSIVNKDQPVTNKKLFASELITIDTLQTIPEEELW